MGDLFQSAEYWVLQPDHSVRPAKDQAEAWAGRLADDEERRVGSSYVGQCWVSTVFYHLNWNLYQPPILFETTVFHADGSAEFIERYATWDDAADGHRRALASLKGCERGDHGLRED